jgi:hypothetical protein
VGTDIRRFLAAVIEGAAELAAVESAWTKAVHLHGRLWSLPYAKGELW